MSTDHLTDLQCPVCYNREVTLIPATGEFSCSFCYVAGMASHLSPHRVFALRNTRGVVSKLTARRQMLRARRGELPVPHLWP
jgi:hypothetical protein